MTSTFTAFNELAITLVDVESGNACAEYPEVEEVLSLLGCTVPICSEFLTSPTILTECCWATAPLENFWLVLGIPIVCKCGTFFKPSTPEFANFGASTRTGLLLLSLGGAGVVAEIPDTAVVLSLLSCFVELVALLVEFEGGRSGKLTIKW